MYLYVVNIHSAPREKPVPAPAADTHFKGQLVDRLENPFLKSSIMPTTFNAPTRRTDNLQIRSDPPIGIPCEPCDVVYHDPPRAASYETIVQETFSVPKKHEPLAIRFLYLDEAIPEDKLEEALDNYYAFIFPSMRVWSASTTGEYSDNSTRVGHFRVRRVELPEGVTAEQMQKEHYPFHDVSGATPFYAKTASGAKIRIPFYAAPSELNTDESVGAFVEYLTHWVASKKATLAWKKAQDAGNPLNKPTAPQSEEFGDYAPFAMYVQPEPKKTPPKKSILGAENRFITFFDFEGARQENILAPCALTPYICEALFPELPYRSTEVMTMMGRTPHLTRALIEKLVYVPPAPAPVVAAPDLTDAKREEAAAMISALWELYRIFDGEYIQKTKDAAYQEKGFTRNLLQAMWRVFVANPKHSSLTAFQSFADSSSYIGGKALPKGLTPEHVIEFFLENIINKHTSDPIHKKSYKMRIGDEIVGLAKVYHCEMNSYNYLFSELDPHSPSLASLNFEPIVETLLNTTKMSEDTKKGWVKAFVHSTILKNGDKTAVLGSSDTHAEFVKWAKNLRLGMGYSAAAMAATREAFVAQFPIAEFTRLMKANGFEMTRRARGMVYLGASWREGLGLGSTKADTASVTETVEEPAGQLLPGNELTLAGTGEDMAPAGFAPIHEETDAITPMGKGAKKREAATAAAPTIVVVDDEGNRISVTLGPTTTAEEFCKMSSLKLANAIQALNPPS